MSEERVELMNKYNKLWSEHNQLCEDYDLLEALYEEALKDLALKAK